MKHIFSTIFAVLCITFVLNVSTANADTGFTADFNGAKHYYPGLYGNFIDLYYGRVSANTPQNDHAKINTSILADTRNLYFGNGYSLKVRYNKLSQNSKLVHDVNSAVAEGRYVGIMNSLAPMHNHNFEYDVCTDGDTKGRPYKSLNADGSASFHHGIVNPKPTTFTTLSGIENIIGFNPGFRERKMSPSALLNEWRSVIFDKYSTDEMIKNHSKNSWCWTRGNDTTDHFKKYFSNAEKNRFVYVAHPPTEYADGLAYVWYSRWYDTHPLTYYENSINLKAIDIKEQVVGTLANLTFSVQNTSSSAIAAKAQIPIEVIVNGAKIDAMVSFPSVWAPDEIQKVTVSGVPLNEGKNTVSMEVNHKLNNMTIGTVANGFRVLTEDGGYDDNKRTKVIDTTADCDEPDCNSIMQIPQVTMCEANQRGTMYIYGNPEYDKEGRFKGCKFASVSLLHHAKLSDNLSSKSLIGSWSSNTKGHNKYKSDKEIPNAVKSVSVHSIGGYSLFIKENKITSHKVKGVDKLKRVIRAGRDVSMYATLHLNVTVQSAISHADNTSKRNALINDIIAKLEVEGYEIDSKAGKVTGNNGKVANKAQTDKARSSSAKIITESTDEVDYGHPRCKKITIYTNTSFSVIPIVTKNVGGKQATDQGDFAITKDYEVNTSKDTKYYTNVNTKNGKHSLRFKTQLDMNKLDSALSTRLTCYTKPENFAVQGNIYDDIQVDDVTDEMDSVDWDF